MDKTKSFNLVIEKCFEELKGTFTEQQAFNMITGVSTLKWMDIDNISVDRKLDIHQCDEIGIHIFKELGRFEDKYPDCKGVFIGQLDWDFIYMNREFNKKLQRVYNIISCIDFTSKNEVRDFINCLVEIKSELFGVIRTPDTIKEIITGLVDWDYKENIANYCAGTSELALHINQYLKNKKSENNVSYYCEEINATLVLISKLLMVVNDVKDNEIINKDVLIDSHENKKFDFAFCDFSHFDKYEFKAYDIDLGSRYLKYGIDKIVFSDWAICQRMIHDLDEGIGIIVGTKGTLVRNNEVRFRRGFLEDNYIEAVITLPTNLYKNTSIGTELIIFNKKKHDSKRNKVLFINASNFSYRLNRNQCAISTRGIEKIIRCYKEWEEEPHFSRIVDLKKIQEYNYTLNPAEYLDVDILKDKFDKTMILSEVAQITKGVQISKKDLEILSNESTHYLLNIKDLESGKILYDKTSMITNKRDEWIGKFDIRPNDILLTTKGASIKVAIVEQEFKPSFISINLTRIRVNEKKYNPYILYEYLQSDIGKRMLEGIQTGTTNKILNNAQLVKLEIPIYDMNFMDEIGECIKKNKILYEKTIEEAAIRFDNTKNEILDRLGWGNS